MQYFDVYFEMYGKKMKATVFAKNEHDAKEMVKGKVVFHKVVKSNPPNDVWDVLTNIIKG